MLKDDLAINLRISTKDLDDIIKSCGFTEIKNFNAVQVNVIKSYIKKANIKSYVQKEVLVIHDTIQCVTVPRKELIELISRAYHKGIEKGKTLNFISDKSVLDELLEEAING